MCEKWVERECEMIAGGVEKIGKDEVKNGREVGRKIGREIGKEIGGKGVTMVCGKELRDDGK